MFTFLLGQENDTIYYFNPENLEECAILEGVSNLGVFFTIDTSWNYYSIQELHLQFISITPLPFNEWIVIHSENFDETPGTVIDSIQIIIDDSTYLSPYWYNIDLNSTISVQNLQGNFWVTGDALLSASCDISPEISGHSYLLWYYSQIWEVGGDFALKAIVKRNDNVSISNNDKNYSKIVDNSYIYNYPNPFNSSTTFHFNLSDIKYHQKLILTIYDIKGRLILNKNLNFNESHYSWDARDNNGHLLSSGIYIAFVQNSTDTFKRKILLVR